MGNFMENLESAFPVKPGLDERRLRGWGHPLPEHQIQMTFRGRFDNPLRMSKPITKPIPVRIPNDALRRIEAAAKKLGSNRSRIAAFAIQKFTEYAENRGVVTLPPDWGAIFKSPGKLKQKPR
jgi:hypothetical protein